MTALRSETWQTKDLHMLAAMHLSEELREAHNCKQFLERQLFEKSASQPVNRAETNRPHERELDLFSVVDRTKERGDKHTGHVICEHLLASLRKQVAEQSAGEAFDEDAFDKKGCGRLANLQVLASGRQNKRVEQAQEQLSLI